MGADDMDVSNAGGGGWADDDEDLANDDPGDNFEDAEGGADDGAGWDVDDDLELPPDLEVSTPLAGKTRVGPVIQATGRSEFRIGGDF
jgi:coatomer protein complex subunit alpha (xenin)